MERASSIAKYLLPNNRKRMDPAVFEAILFLKVHQSYCDLKSVLTEVSPTAEGSGQRGAICLQEFLEKRQLDLVDQKEIAI